MIRRSLSTLAALCGLAATAQAEPIEFRYGLDVFEDRSTILEGLQSIGAFREIGPGLHFGHVLYSAALGDAGGLYIGGFELHKRVSVGPRTELEFGGFIGGGGGAALVAGDGLMTRFHAGVKYRLTDTLAANAGIAHIEISGSPVSSSALYFGVSRDVEFAFGTPSSGPAGGGRTLVAVKPVIKQYLPRGNLQRSGTPLQDMTLVGFEATFASSPEARLQSFIQTTGAVAGDGEGFADIQGGLRWSTAARGLRAFGEVAAGFGGGGDVDTGGGVIGTVGGGVVVPIARGFEIEAGAQYTAALEGDFQAVAPFLRASLRFGERSSAPYGDIRNWQLSLGITSQQANDTYRNPGVVQDASPVLTESSLDLFLTDRTYLTGNAQTVIDGDAGGYALGALGLGYQVQLTDRWGLAIEGLVGAAGGGGVDTNGGLVGLVKLEADYWVKDNLAISAGVGHMRPLRGSGGAQPTTLHLGFKTRFTTSH
jgi:hypothetical protein